MHLYMLYHFDFPLTDVPPSCEAGLHPAGNSQGTMGGGNILLCSAALLECCSEFWSLCLVDVCHDKRFPDPWIWKWTCEAKILLSTSAKLNQLCLVLPSESVQRRPFKLWKSSYFCLCRAFKRDVCSGFFFLFLEINCCVCGIQWTNHFECPALLLLLLALSKLSPTHSAVVYLALGWRLVLPALLSWFNYFSSCWDNIILCCTSDTTYWRSAEP